MFRYDDTVILECENQPNTKEHQPSFILIFKVYFRYKTVAAAPRFTQIICEDSNF